MKGYRFIFVFALFLLLAACGAPSVDPNVPPQIVYGEDVCAHCGMIISDERFASSIVVEKSPNVYEHLIFDDIGDMFAYVQEAGAGIQIVTYFVHDFHSREWLDARQAYFVKAPAATTPMGSGFAAFAGEMEAEAQAQAWQASVLDFDGAQAHAPATGHTGHSH
jgi:copper chaperone NosL